MTRLKIEVTADDDAAARTTLVWVLALMSNDNPLRDAGYTVRQSFGTATATVEREQGSEQMKCECCGAAITRNDRTDGCPKCWRMRCVHCDTAGEPCRVCEMGDGKGAT